MDPYSRLLLKRRRESTDSLPLQVDTHFNAVRYLDERDAAIHAVVLAVKGHGPNNDAREAAFAGIRELQFLFFSDSTDREISVQLEGQRPCLCDFRRPKRNVGIFFGVEKVLAS